MKLISLLVVLLILAALSFVVLDSLDGNAGEPCAPGRTSTTSPVSLPPGLEQALTHC